MGYRDKLTLWIAKVSDRDLLEVFEDDGIPIFPDEYVVHYSGIFPVIPRSWKWYSSHI
jgi:hypothetical protein